MSLHRNIQAVQPKICGFHRQRTSCLLVLRHSYEAIERVHSIESTHTKRHQSRKWKKKMMTNVSACDQTKLPEMEVHNMHCRTYYLCEIQVRYLEPLLCSKSKWSTCIIVGGHNHSVKRLLKCKFRMQCRDGKCI